MRSRLRVTLLSAGLALAWAAAAHAYPWPVRPFDKPHPVRANFGDPRTIFSTPLFPNGMLGAGSFTFHNGIDISAPDGTPVYPVASGIARLVNGATVAVTTNDGRAFQYYHVTPTVLDGDLVTARKTILGFILRGAGHVHLSEFAGGRVINPLARGHLKPYIDTLHPRVASIQFRQEGTLRELEPLGICGRVSIVAEAYDTPQLKIPGSFVGFPVTPAYVSWSLRRWLGPVVVKPTAAADFRGTLPLAGSFWDVYARGTYQNAPRFGTRQFGSMPGRYFFNLRSDFDTRQIPNGVYLVSVRAADMRSNAGTATRRFTVSNIRGTPTGCPTGH